MVHARLVIFLFALMIGAAGTALALWIPRRSGPRGLAGQLVCFNLLLLINLLYAYAIQAGTNLSPLDIAYHAVSIALKLLWITFYVSMVASMVWAAVPKLRWIGAVLTVLWVAAVGEAGLRPQSHLLVGVHQGVEVAVLVSAWCATFAPMIRARRRPLPRLVLFLAVVWTFAALSIGVQSAWPATRDTLLALNALWILAYNGGFCLALRRSWNGPAAAPDPDWGALVRRHDLSARERDIVQLICQGKRNQEIADALFLSLQTVKDYNHRIFRKLGVRNRVELVNRARGDR